MSDAGQDHRYKLNLDELVVDSLETPAQQLPITGGTVHGFITIFDSTCCTGPGQTCNTNEETCTCGTDIWVCTDGCSGPVAC